jgi:CRISPR-associated endonuclease Cas2
MHRLLISYDLRWPTSSEEDYEELYKALAKIGAERIQESVWAVRTSKASHEIFEQLSHHIHAGDRLLVARIGGFKNVGGINLLKFI